MKAQELEDLKEDIAEAKNKKARAEGRIEQIQEDWKKNHDCDCLQDVKVKIETLDKKETKLTKAVDEQSDEIEELLENNK